MVSRFFVIGGYRGMKEKYGKRISPHFNTYEQALHYKQTYGVFSLSLSDGTIARKFISMKIEFVIVFRNTNKNFCGYEKYNGEPKFRHINFPNERVTFDDYASAEKEIAVIFERYNGDEELRLQIEKHYAQES